MSAFGRLPAPARRLIYRVGYVVLQVLSAIVRPRTRGVKCVVFCDGAVLLVRHAYGPKQWDIPGGFCRPREAFSNAARREVAEELGIRDARWTSLGEWPRAIHGRKETLGIFRVEVDSPDLLVDDGEITEVRWCAPDALPLPRAEIVDFAFAAVSATR